MKNVIESIKSIYKTEERASEIEKRNFDITQIEEKKGKKKEERKMVTKKFYLRYGK